MKKTLLIAALFIITGIVKVDAQIVNNSFENWYQDTFYLPNNELSGLPADTISFMDPIGWTSSNSLTDLDSVGRKIFVTQSPNAYSGNSAVQMITDTIKLPVAAHFPSLNVIFPGFVVNGIFPITSIKLSGGIKVISPTAIPGAGQPFTQRLQTINGYYNYAPAFNANSQSNDTCIIWAALRKGTTVVANAIFKSTVATSGYNPFHARFEYVSCEVPDTLVILMASSVPDVSPILSGSLPAGSMLLVDSLTYDTLPDSYVFAPFAVNDLFTIIKNTTDTFNVLANDTDCSGVPLTISSISTPAHGTATLLSDYGIAYTPTANYTGLDYIYYVDKNGGNDTAGALCTIFINNNTGINDVNEVRVNLYPVPSDNVLHIQFQNPGRCRGNIYDLVGNLVMSAELNSSNNTVSTQNLPVGIYGIELLNSDNTVIGRSKFVIAR
jgi:hypothetical protein